MKRKHRAVILSTLKFAAASMQTRKPDPPADGVEMVVGELTEKMDGTLVVHAYLFDAETFTPDQAREWLTAKQVDYWWVEPADDEVTADPVGVANEPGQPYAEAFTESVHGDEIEFRGKILLEAAPEQGDGRVRGKIPLIKAGVYTLNHNRYLQECLDWLKVDVGRLAESASSQRILDMYLTHRPVTSEHMNPLREKAGRIREVLVESDMASIRFETIGTGAGRDAAELLRESMIVGVSLRATPIDSVANDQGGLDVKRMRLIGADFTDTPGMESAVGFQLEESPMNWKQIADKLKTLSKDAAKALLESFNTEEQGKILEHLNAQEKATLLEEATNQPGPEMVAAQQRTTALEAQNRALVEEKRAGKADVYKEKAAAKLTEEKKTYSDGIRNKVLEAVRGRIYAVYQQRADGSWPTDAELDAALDASLKEECKPWDDLISEQGLGTQRQQMQESQGHIITRTGQTFSPAQISTLKPEDRQNGLLSEETGGSTNPVDIICAKALQVPVFKNGESIFEEFNPWLSELIGNQRKYMRRATKPGSILESQGLNFENMLLEAGEQTSVTTTPGATASLPADLADAIIRLSFPKTVAASIARMGTMKSTTKTIYTREYHAYGYNKFGSIAYGGSFSTSGDEGAVTYPKKAYAVVTTAVDTATVFTVTYTNQNGTTSQTASVTVPATAVAGDRFEIIPTNIGDLFTDITTATGTGYTSAGAVDFCCEDEPTEAGEATAYNKGRTNLTSQTLTAVDLEIGASLSHTVIEDMMMAIQDGAGGYDVVADLAGLLAADMADYIDRYMIYQIQANAGITGTFAQSTPSSGYTQQEWNATVESKISQVTDAIEMRSNFQPNWMLINTTDRGRMASWLKDNFIASQVNASDPFRNARSVGTVYGNATYASNNVDRGRWLFGSSQEGVRYEIYIPLRLLGPQWDPSANVNAILRRQRAALAVVLATTLGKLTIS